MYLHMAELMLDGAVPYVDFVEINPPLVIYLSAVPVVIARAVGVGVVQVFNILLAMFAGYGAWALVRHLPRIAPKVTEPYRHLVACIWLGFSFLILIAGHWSLPTVVTGTDYGQREHLIALGYVPFLALRVVRHRVPDADLSRAEAVVSGALAGVMLCLKPHYIGAAAAVELYLLVECKRFRPLRAPEVIAACAMGIAYAVHFAFVPAAMRDAFFGRWLPLASSRYAAYHWPWDHVFSLRTLHVSWLLPLALFLPWREPYRSIARRAAPPAVFALGASVVMIVQHKGWPYHVIPMTAGITLTLALVLAEVMQHQEEGTHEGQGRLWRIQRAIVHVRAPLAIVLIGAWFASVVRLSPALFRRFTSPTLAVIRRVTDEGDAVMYVSTAVQTVYAEQFHSRRRPGSRYHWTFPIAYLFEGKRVRRDRKQLYQPPAGREDENETLLHELVTDVKLREPKLVFVWRSPGCQGCPAGFSIASYLRHHRFEQRALGGYFMAERIGHWDVWAKQGVGLKPLRKPRKPRAPRR